MESVDIAPTWSSVLPLWLNLYEQNARYTKANCRRIVENARLEFVRMASVADKYRTLLDSVGKERIETLELVSLLLANTTEEFRQKNKEKIEEISKMIDSYDSKTDSY